MSLKLEEVEREITALSPEEKLYILEKLVREAHGSISSETDELWYREAEARHNAISAGTMDTVPWNQVRADARKLL